MRFEHSLDDAIVQLAEAHRLDPDTPLIRIELARAHLWARNYDAASGQLESLKLLLPQMSEWSRRKYHDLQIQIHQRNAADLARDKDYFLALSSLLRAREAYEACPPFLRDAQIRMSLGRCFPTARQTASSLDDAEMRGLADSLAHWLHSEASVVVPNVTALPEGFRRGWIARLVRDRGFGFIRGEDGNDLFFHMSELTDKQAWDLLEEETSVMFHVGVGERGPIATNISLVEDV